MGEILKAYIVPHPPIVVPEVGKGNENGASATLHAYDQIARQIGELAPDVIIVTTPHGPAYGDYIHISAGKRLTGSFRSFGAPEVSLEFTNDTELIDKLTEIALAHGIEAGGLGTKEKEIDHGALVPLYFVNRYYTKYLLVRISIAGLPLEELYKFGFCIQKAVTQMDRRVVFIGSGDLSHRLKDDGPYGFSPEGPEFDKAIEEIVRKVDFKRLVELDGDLCEKAVECGLRSFTIMAGALNSYAVKSKILSYEGPFGVGYMIAELDINGQDLSRDLISFYEIKRKSELEATRKAEDPYVALARLTLETFVKKGRVIEIPDYLPEELLSRKAGVFVSLKKQGLLRGCIGTISPVTESIAEEIIQNAISSGTRDPRFNPVKAHELGDLVYSVDVLGEPEPIKDISELDVVRYGVIVSSGYKRGLLLPNLEGVDTPQQQVEIALSKADIRPNESYSMERFEVVRHS
ncbi:MAG: AmmeMemoRadiSam system protein A [Clostridia bacterium]|nr:AmmeMemoRadiSam system protein A [Clostridia bacterium]